MGVLNVGPSTPTESSSGVPAGGFSQWFRNIGDWIKGMSPSGAADYDTGWVVVPLAPGFQPNGIAPVVRRVGKQIIWRGQVQPNPTGSFAINSVITIADGAGVPGGFRPLEIVNRMASGGAASHAARINIDASGKISLVTGASTSTYYDLSALSGYMVD